MDEDDISVAARVWATNEREREIQFRKRNGMPMDGLPSIATLEIAFFGGANWAMKRESRRDERRHAEEMARLNRIAGAAP